MDTSWWKENWHSSTIHSNHTQQQTSLFIWLLFALSMGGCSYYLLEYKQQLLQHYEAENYIGLLVALVFLIPVVLLTVGIKKTRSNIDFGDTLLVMNPFPAVVGHAFLAEVKSIKNAGEQPFFAELLLHTYTKNPQAIANGKSEEEATYKKLWCMPVTVKQQAHTHGLDLSLEARLPDNAPPSLPDSFDEYYQWQLHVFTKDSRFKRTWDIPIVCKKD